ncbi:MAG: DNA/RNA non-specific endonuclease [Ruminococcus sp.]|nr:DNA/RNA non-specific endonuclease [Ruminococcus sp.]
MKRLCSVLLALFLGVALAVELPMLPVSAAAIAVKPMVKYTVSTVPEFSNSPYVEINGNVPSFTSAEITTKAFETYSELDDLGRCGVAFANICKETMPTESRGAIGMVKPSGWHTVKYDFVDGKYLYNRCHLIGYQLAGENANTRNLITGTRYLNINGMLQFEDTVAYYVEQTGNHVLYRVTPVFKGRNLVASGVQIEAYSVEDKGKGVSFNVYCYNAQPGVVIDYSTGDSKLAAVAPVDKDDTVRTGVAPGISDSQASAEQGDYTYVFNKNSKRFHSPDCPSVDEMKAKNREYFYGTREEAINKGYKPCGRCNP